MPKRQLGARSARLASFLSAVDLEVALEGDVDELLLDEVQTYHLKHIQPTQGSFE